ncbi:MaoC family dehydratase N-terminal domain-containing protein [Halobacillus rhizosphaerae]|uniref:FAS1-like dehydratase domain-containing protein n=1 Tax=Halobacillus rhizosphaerae TaxID=3064889 RepID=UPI00398B8FD9
MIDKWIGHTTPQQSITIGIEEAVHFAKAIQPGLSFSKSLKEGKTIFLPPTMAITFMNKIQVPWLRESDGLIHAKQSFDYRKRLAANHPYLCTLTLEEVFAKPGKRGLMTFVIQSLAIYDEEDLQATARTTLVLPERGEVK